MRGQPELVLLVGFMGAGKTTVGRQLAQMLNWSFYDLDALIAGRTGRTVPALFAEQGESGFRKLEAQTLRELFETLEDEPAVVALGGGAFVQEAVRQIIRDHSASVVHLEVGFEEALRRCADAPGERPLLSNRAQAALLYEQRLPFYRTAEVQLRTDGEAPAAIAQKIAARLQLSPNDQEVQ